MSAVNQHAVKALPFTRQLGFRKTLNERIEAHLHDNNLSARDVPAMYVKTIIVSAWWLVTYLLILLGGFPTLINAFLCVGWALAIAAIGFSLMHDANHNAYSNHPRVNKLLALSAELAGISGLRWRTKHNVWHHVYTNIVGLDDDVETYGTLRLSPHQPWKPLFRMQHWYFPLVYSLILFDFIMRDFMMVFAGQSDANHVYPTMNRGDKSTFWLGKALFFTIMICLPLLFFPWWQVVIGFVLVALTVGFVTGIVFQLAHIMEAADFPEPAGDPLHIDNEWAIHEVETTVNFAPRNRLLNWYIGGLNYQIEHHLLPHICHLNYPRLALIVRATCEEFGVMYHSHDTWRQAFTSHWRALRRMGRRPEPVANASAGNVPAT